MLCCGEGWLVMVWFYSPQWPWWIVTITAIIIIIVIIMIIPFVVAVLYYWMIFFLSMICCNLKHLWSSVFLRNTIQMEKKNLAQLFAFCLRPPNITLRTLLPPRFLWPWTSQAWLDNLNMTFITLPFVMTSSVPRQCTDYAHFQYAPCLFISAFITSVSDCLLSQQDLVSNILTDVVKTYFSDSNWTTTSLLHQWCPCWPTVLVIQM